MRKRTKNNEEHIDAIEKELAEMQNWRAELEERTKLRNEQVEEHFKQNEDKFDKHVKETKDQFSDDNDLLGKHSSYLRKLDAALAATNSEIESM